MEKLLEQFSVGLFAWQTILFVALLLLLRKFAWKPILEAVNKRQQSIQDSMDLAEKTRAEMAQLSADNEKLLAEARLERDKILREAKQTADGMIAEAKDNAAEEGDKMIAAAKQAIETEKKAALAEVKNQVATLSVDIAEKILRKELSTKDSQRKLVDDLIKDVNIN